MSETSYQPLAGKVVVITGAAGGMGISIATLMAEQGAVLALLDRDEDRLNQTTSNLRTAGAVCEPIVCDLGEPSQIENAAAFAESKFGAVDVLVNNAGILPRAEGLETLSPETWDLMFKINVRAPFLCAQHFCKSMLKRGSGSIVNVASIAAKLPNSHGAYSATKAAVVALTRQMAVEWGPRGLRANSVSPGMILTPMTQAVYEDRDVLNLRAGAVASRRIGQSSDIANAIAWLSSDQAAYVNGQNIEVDGGFGLTALMRMQPKDLQPQPPY